MQKNLPKYAPDWIARTVGVGARVAARGRLRAVQRPAHAAVVRQPAGRRVPPELLRVDEHRRGAARAGPRPAAGGRLHRRGGRRPARPRGPFRGGAGRRGEDERGEGPARVSCRSRARRRSTTPPRPPGPSRPAPPARPGRRHHGVHQGGPAREGVRRPHAGRWRHPRRVLQPPGPPRRAGVVPGRLGRPRRGEARPTSRSTPRSPPSATATRGAPPCPPRRSCPPSWSRRATRSPCPGGGDARGQAPPPRRGQGRRRRLSARGARRREACGRLLVVRDRTGRAVATLRGWRPGQEGDGSRWWGGRPSCPSCSRCAPRAGRSSWRGQPGSASPASSTSSPVGWPRPG